MGRGRICTPAHIAGAIRVGDGLKVSDEDCNACEARESSRSRILRVFQPAVCWWREGKVRRATNASRPITGSISRLPSGPVEPPLSQSGPIERVVRKWLPAIDPPLFAVPNRKD